MEEETVSASEPDSPFCFPRSSLAASLDKNELSIMKKDANTDEYVARALAVLLSTSKELRKEEEGKQRSALGAQEKRKASLSAVSSGEREIIKQKGVSLLLCSIERRTVGRTRSSHQPSLSLSLSLSVSRFSCRFLGVGHTCPKSFFSSSYFWRTNFIMRRVRLITVITRAQ